MKIERDLGILTLLMVNTLLFTTTAFRMELFEFLLQALFISFYCFLTLSYSYTILRKEQNQSMPIIIFILMILNMVLVQFTIEVYLILTTSILIGISSLCIRIYKKRKKIIKKKYEIEKELDDNWEEEPHLIFEDSDIGRMV